jgi:pimeloyl-ACP methyl ester carboxylesterase
MGGGLRGAGWIAAGVLAMTGMFAGAAQAELLGVACPTPPAAHCPDADCPVSIIGDEGNAVEPKTGRKFFLDYPCDLKPGEKVIFILSLHGGGSIGNWQRHYFPAMDFKEKYRLVIATPTGVAFGNTGGHGWSPVDDDAYLQNVVTEVEGALGKSNIKAFWLVGHSLGGQTANRLLLTDFFRQRLTGWVSLSGGRLGSKREDVRAAIPFGAGGGAPPAPPPGAPPGGGMRLAADASILPEYPFSFIYVTGEHELTPAGLPGVSLWAQKLACGPQTRGPDIVDPKAGYVYDTRPQANPSPIWGGKARPGSARVYLYPGCPDHRVVADIVRIDKGHTEGYEPNLTDAILKMVADAS